MDDTRRKVLVTGGSGFIGTTMVGRLLDAGWDVFNFDLKAPRVAHHARHWIAGDILDRAALAAAFDRATPEAVIHLAARTDTLSETLSDYRVNIEGSANVVDACRDHPMAKRLVFTSSQFVYGPSGVPQHDEDFLPHTVYGESKAASERHLRNANLDCCWTIVRPTNIWGPWHPRYPHEFWRVLKRGLYMHPKGPDVIRCYGYVGTVADQIMTILAMPIAAVDRKMVYLGDPPLRLIEWTNGFSLALTGRPVRQVPLGVLRLIAVAGDAVQAATGRPAPLTSSRLRSMTESYTPPMTPTFALLGQPRSTLQEGIDETVRWLSATLPQFRTAEAPPARRAATS